MHWGCKLLIAAGFVVLAGAGFVYWMVASFVSDVTQTFRGDTAKDDPLPIIRPLSRFTPDQGQALILHEAFTGLSTPIVISDQAALAAAKGRLFYNDDPGAETKMVFLSILFLSPPGNGTRRTMATLTGPDGSEKFDCYMNHCRADAADFEFDLAGLADLGRPVQFESTQVRTAAAFDNLAHELRTDPNKFPTSLPERPDWTRGTRQITLPTFIRVFDAQPDLLEFDDTALKTAITARLPKSISLSRIAANIEPAGRTVLTREGLTPLREGETRVTFPKVPIYTTVTAHLAGPLVTLDELNADLFEGLPLPEDQSEDLDAAFAAFVESVDPTLDPLDYGLQVMTYSETTTLSHVRAPSAFFSWYEVIP